jgi:hypothetical protein
MILMQVRIWFGSIPQVCAACGKLVRTMTHITTTESTTHTTTATLVLQVRPREKGQKNMVSAITAFLKFCGVVSAAIRFQRTNHDQVRARRKQEWDAMYRQIEQRQHTKD